MLGLKRKWMTLPGLIAGEPDKSGNLGRFLQEFFKRSFFKSVQFNWVDQDFWQQFLHCTMLGWTPSVQSSPHIYVWKMGVGTRVCMRVYLWIGKISWRFHKHTILQISLKIWAGGLRVIPKNGETKSGPNRANSQRNTNTQNTEFMNLDSILLLCAKVIFSEMEKILKLKLRSS